MELERPTLLRSGTDIEEEEESATNVGERSYRPFSLRLACHCFRSDSVNDGLGEP